MDACDKELTDNKEIQKRRLKAKTVSATNPDGSNVRVSNYIKIIDKHHVVFILKKIKKVLNTWKWIKAGKVIYSRRN